MVRPALGWAGREQLNCWQHPRTAQEAESPLLTSSCNERWEINSGRRALAVTSDAIPGGQVPGLDCWQGGGTRDFSEQPVPVIATLAFSYNLT